MKRTGLGVLAVVALLAVASGCKEQQSMASEESAPGDDRAEVVAAPPRVATIPNQLQFAATVVAPNMYGVSAKVPGTVLEVLVDEGQTVTKGQVVLRLDSEDYTLQREQAEKALASAEARLEQLKVAAEIERESLTLGVAQAEASLEQVRARSRMVDEGARPEEKRQVAAAVEMARTQMDAMERETDRMKRLYEDEVIPKQRLEELQDGYKVAQAQFRQASAQLKLVKLGAREGDRDAMAAAVKQVEHAVALARVSLKQIEARKLDVKAAELAIEQARTGVALAKLAEGRTEVTAPHAGVVESVTARAGMMAAPGVPLIMLADSSDLEIRALLQQEEVRSVRNGMPATYALDGVEGAETLSAKVKYVGAIVDQRTGGFPVTLGVAAKDAPGLKGGMHVHGNIVVGTHPDTLLVPMAAVLRQEGAKVVFTVEDGLARRVEVETGATMGQELEVLTGLNRESLVVHQGHLGLVDGVSVKSLPAAAKDEQEVVQ